MYALAADPESALIEYLEMFYNLRHAGTALTRLGVVDFATTIAPGLRDVLLTGKAVEAARRRTGGRPLYDAVVMDAPPTGRIGNFLNVATEISGLAKVGPIRGHADTVQSFINSPQTAVHFVTVLEEMPVQETLDGIAELRGLAQGGLQLGGIMINMVRPEELADEQLRAAAAGTLDEHELGWGSRRPGSRTGAAWPGSLRGRADPARPGGTRPAGAAGRLAEAGQPRYELPLVNGRMDLAGLYRLAAALREQGAA